MHWYVCRSQLGRSSNMRRREYIFLSMYKWVWIFLESNSIQENCSLGTLFWCQHLKLTILRLTAINCHSKLIIYHTWFICNALFTHHLCTLFHRKPKKFDFCFFAKKCVSNQQRKIATRHLHQLALRNKYCIFELVYIVIFFCHFFVF